MGDGGGSASEVNAHKNHLISCGNDDICDVSESSEKSAEKCRARCSHPSVNCSFCGALVRQVFPLTRELRGGWVGEGGHELKNKKK